LKPRPSPPVFDWLLEKRYISSPNELINQMYEAPNTTASCTKMHFIDLYNRAVINSD